MIVRRLAVIFGNHLRRGSRNPHKSNPPRRTRPGIPSFVTCRTLVGHSSFTLTLKTNGRGSRYPNLSARNAERTGHPQLTGGSRVGHPAGEGLLMSCESLGFLKVPFPETILF